jgi:hypothetical protein
MEQTAFDHLENSHFLTHLRQNPALYPTLWVKRRLSPNRIASEPPKPRQVFGKFSILAKSPGRGCGPIESRRASDEFCLIRCPSNSSKFTNWTRCGAVSRSNALSSTTHLVVASILS